MTDDNDLVTVAEFLTAQERDRLKGVLDSLRIPFVVSGHGPQSRIRVEYFLIKVRKRDYAAAADAVKKRKAKMLIENRKCPKCENSGYTKIEKKGLWQRIYYFGTTLVVCNKCKHKYFI